MPIRACWRDRRQKVFAFLPIYSLRCVKKDQTVNPKFEDDAAGRLIANRGAETDNLVAAAMPAVSRRTEG
jgi:hypothetical protein